MSLKETEKTMSNIVQLLHDANEPASNIVTSLGKAAKGGPLMEVIMRFASGTGLWRQLNYIKAIGITITSWNESGIEQRKQRMEQIANLAKEVKIYEDIKKQKDSELDTNNEIYKGLEAMYGQTYARARLEEQINEAYDVQAKKMKDIKRSVPNEELLDSIRGRTMWNFNTEDTERLQLAKDRGLGKIKNVRGAKEFIEYGPIKKFFTVRWKKLGRTFTKVGELITGMGKMLWSFLKGGLLVMGQVLLWGSLLIILAIIAKPFIIGFWKKLEKRKDTVIAIFNSWWEFIKPLWVTVYERANAFWQLFKDPDAKIGETLKALAKLAWAIFTAVVGTITTFVGMLLFQLVAAIGSLINWAVETGLPYLATNLPIWMESALDNIYKSFIEWWDNKTDTSQTKQSTTQTIGLIRYLTHKVGLDKPAYIGEPIAMADGGFVANSGQYLVGERGPEIVNLKAGSNVTPNHKIGNTINVHVNGRVGASDTELRDIARKVGSMINREINRTTSTGVRL